MQLETKCINQPQDPCLMQGMHCPMEKQSYVNETLWEEKFGASWGWSLCVICFRVGFLEIWIYWHTDQH